MLQPTFVQKVQLHVKLTFKLVKGQSARIVVILTTSKSCSIFGNPRDSYLRGRRPSRKVLSLPLHYRNDTNFQSIAWPARPDRPSSWSALPDRLSMNLAQSCDLPKLPRSWRSSTRPLDRQSRQWPSRLGIRHQTCVNDLIQAQVKWQHGNASRQTARNVNGENWRLDEGSHLFEPSSVQL